jgi:tetratricopeptide (TPR) repeat protein
MSTAPAAPLVQTFMTHRMSDASIEMLATGREVETQRIMDAVERSLRAAPGALQHMVIYGPRGFGKSFIARLVQIETGKLAAARSLPVPFVLLPEEQHNLTRNPHALPAYITHRLADLRSGEDRSWTGAMFQWPEPKKEAQQWDEATAALEAELDRSLPAGKGMAIVVIENFDFLLFSVFKEAATEQRLRKWLDRRNNRLMLIATATGSVDMDYERPLFQAFQSIRLEPWEQETCIAYFNRRRQAEGKAPLDAAMEAKARAVADFIGGNPRLAQLLAEVLETQDALTVADTMKALADKLSDYYRRRIDDLPPLVQGLLDALIRGGEPASQTELAERVGAPAQSTIARVMQDLQRSDIIRGLPAPDSRETLYRVTDRVFVHFYRLRQGSQLALQTPLATILEFLRAFYSHDEQKTQAMNYLDAGRHAEARLFADLAQEGQASAAISNGYFLEFGTRLQCYLDATGEVLPVPLAELLQEMEDCPERLIGRVDAWKPSSPVFQAITTVLAAQALAHLGLLEEADERLVRQLATSAGPVTEVLLRNQRCLLFFARCDESAAVREATRVGELREAELPGLLKTLAHCAWAWVLGQSASYQDALASAREAADLAVRAGDLRLQAEALKLVGWSLGQLNRHEEAIASAREAATLAARAGNLGGQAEALRHAGWSLGQLNRHDEAISSAREAAALAAQARDLGERTADMVAIAHSLNRLGHRREALVEALAGFELAYSIADGWGIAETAIEAVLAAVSCPSPQAVSAFAGWVTWALDKPSDERESSWNLWLGQGLAAATRARAWEAWDTLIEGQGERMRGSHLFTSEVGRAIALRGESDGRAEGFEAARAALPRLVQLWELIGAEESARDSQLGEFVAGLAAHCRDPGLLRDVAGLLTTDISPQASTSASLLIALAQVDEADDPQAVLARTDPDSALWLRRIRDLPEAPARPPRRRK